MAYSPWFSRIIKITFAFLFALIPLFFTPVNSELFEFNKILLLYAGTSIIAACWLALVIARGKILFRRSFLDLPLLLFVLSQVVSTLISIDPHTSLLGYYSRFNGGLLSIVCYAFLYWAFIIHIDRETAKKLLNVSLLAGFLVSLWGIGEHFGFSLSCLLFEGSFGVKCWVQDVQNRVFASLGQPNWLGSYLLVLIFFSLYSLFRTGEKSRISIAYFIFTLVFYLCLLFTQSRSAYLGLIVGLSAAIMSWFINRQGNRRTGKLLLALPVVALLLTFIFNSPFHQINRYFSLNVLTKPNTTNNPPTVTGPQLENGGTESGIIRQIVWQGAIDIFRHYPIFGSGVETFAYSYYNFRPVAHNLVSEWDFLYNKAHNEYLNFLATTGILGLTAYLSWQLAFVFWCFRYILKSKKSPDYHPLAVSLTLGAYLGLSICHFFGFSVVISNLYLFLLPAFCFILIQPPDSLPAKKTNTYPASWPSYLYLLPLALVIFCLWQLVTYWRADFFYANGDKLAKANQFVPASYQFNTSVQLNPKEPVILAESANTMASLALLAAQSQDATSASQYGSAALNLIEQALQISPRNLNLRKTQVKVTYTLSTLDPVMLDQAIDQIQQAITLAPTDPKLVYNLGLLYGRQEKADLAIATIKKAVELKPNYVEALTGLAIFYEDLGDNQNALITWRRLEELVPHDQVVKDKINSLSQ